MPTWAFWTTFAIVIWAALAGFVILAISRIGRIRWEEDVEPSPRVEAAASEDALVFPPAWDRQPRTSGRVVPGKDSGLTLPTRVLVVDDDPGLRALLRTSFEIAHIDVDEADGATSAATAIASHRPDAIVLDVAMPGIDGISFCRQLKADPSTRAIPVVLLTGDSINDSAGQHAGAEAFLRKPFSPLALLAAIEGLAVSTHSQPTLQTARAGDEQLLLYAQDFRRLLELERGQRLLLQQAYRETAVALARALESKDGHTAAHCERVRRYATELAAAADPDLLRGTGLEYGFILHDVGKIGIPDAVLAKPGALTETERRLLETHPLLGHQMIGQAALLRGPGTQVVRSHHERWDGHGYPDRLAGDAIPLGARVFAIADALDAITSDRPYRPANSWDHAITEITSQAGSQFDPDLVHLLHEHEETLRGIHYEVSNN